MKTHGFRRILLAIAIVAATASNLPASVQTWNRDGLLYGVYDPVVGREWLSLDFTTGKSLNQALDLYVNPSGSTFRLASLAEVLDLVQRAGVPPTGYGSGGYAAANDLISKWGMTYYRYPGVEYTEFMFDNGSGLVYCYPGDLDYPAWGLYIYRVGLNPPDYMSSLGTALVRDVGTVPEPTTLLVWSLLGASGIGLGWWKRKRQAA